MAMVLSGTIWNAVMAKAPVMVSEETVKRLADQASLHGSEIVDADSLYLWGHYNQLKYPFLICDSG